MKILNKKLGWWNEKVGGPIAGILVGVAVFFIDPEEDVISTVS